VVPHEGTTPYNQKVNDEPNKRINLSLSQAQHSALVELSRERGIPVQALIRSGVTAVTSVPDPIISYRRRAA
jgi:hypothetical protein